MSVEVSGDVTLDYRLFECGFAEVVDSATINSIIIFESYIVQRYDAEAIIENAPPLLVAELPINVTLFKVALPLL